MKQTSILCVFCICIALTGCIKNEYTPLSSRQPASKLYADTMGLLEAFTKHEELRALFEQAASGSISLADIKKADYYTYDYYNKGTDAYFYRNNEGKTITDDSMCVDKKTADAIHKLGDLLPGVSIRMRTIEGKLCVNFYIMKNTTGEDNGYYGEEIYYSSDDISSAEEVKLIKIGEDWWFVTLPMIK